MSHSTNKANTTNKDGLSERSYLAAAHREDRSEEGREESLEKAKEIHLARTGSELNEDLEKKNDKIAQPGLASTEEGRKERGYIAAAHREGRDEEGKKESLEKASKLHEERTGEPLNEQEESSDNKHKKDAKKDSKKDSKKPKSSKDDEKSEKESKKGSKGKKSKSEESKDDDALERQERALIAAAHRKGRDTDARLESLAKASKIHEERTGEPLPEAVEKGAVEDQSENPHKRHHKDENDASPKRQKAEDKDEEKVVIAGHKVEQPGLAGSAAGRQERAFIAAAHREGRSEEGMLESLEKASEIHEQRTGEPLSEAVEKGLAEEKPEDDSHKRRHEDHKDDDKNREDEKDDKDASGKRQKTEGHEDEKVIIGGHEVDQPGLAGSASGRQERAFIAAAHREGRSEEGKLESLEKASELHKKRTGEPLQEAVDLGVAKAAQ